MPTNTKNFTMRHLLATTLCAAALCGSSVAIAQPIFTPLGDSAAVAEIESDAAQAPAPASAEFTDPQPDYAFLLPGKLTESTPDASLVPAGASPAAEDSDTAPIGIAFLGFGATMFVFMVDAWGGRRWRRRRRYRFVLESKPEYQERAAV